MGKRKIGNDEELGNLRKRQCMSWPNVLSHSQTVGLSSLWISARPPAFVGCEKTTSTLQQWSVQDWFNSSAIYSSLDKEAKEIRLLRLDEAQGDEFQSGNIWLRMETVSLKDIELDYDALSYAWGDPNCTKEVRVNGNRVPVANNLFAALSLLSKPELLRRQIWIDAICIDQENLSERSQQVALMRQIYEGAENVHIYLGNGTDNSTATFESAERLVKGASVQDLIKEGLLTNAHLRDLFTCSWWTRLWVLQEVALAKSPVVHWGSASIPFWKLVNTMAVARNAKVDGLFDKRRKARKINQEHWLYNFDRAIYTFTVLKDPSLTPELLLSVCSNLVSSDERDRIYGVLALLPALECMAPDYALPPGNIFQRTTIEVMKHQRDLRLLRLVRQTIHSRFQLRPSWVPSFNSIGGLIGQHMDGYGFQGINKTVPFLLEEFGDTGIQVNARLFDRILIVGPACGLEGRQDQRAESRKRDAQEHLRRTLRDWYLIALEEVEGVRSCSCIPECRSARHSPSCNRLAFWRTVLCDGLLSLATGRRDQDLGRTISAFDGWLRNGERHATISAYQHHQLQLLAGASTFFITENGLMGLSRSHVQIGDVIALLGGDTVPYVLQPRSGTESNAYFVVGSCFVNELMYEETIEEVLSRQGDRGTQYKMEDMCEKIVLT